MNTTERKALEEVKKILDSARWGGYSCPSDVLLCREALYRAKQLIQDILYPKKPAECFPLGKFLMEELSKRMISVEDFCKTTLMLPRRVKELLVDPAGTVISSEEAKWLGSALDVSPTFLLNIQNSYLERRKDNE